MGRVSKECCISTRNTSVDFHKCVDTCSSVTKTGASTSPDISAPRSLPSASLTREVSSKEIEGNFPGVPPTSKRRTRRARKKATLKDCSPLLFDDTRLSDTSHVLGYNALGRKLSDSNLTHTDGFFGARNESDTSHVSRVQAPPAPVTPTLESRSTDTALATASGVKIPFPPAPPPTSASSSSGTQTSLGVGTRYTVPTDSSSDDNLHSSLSDKAASSGDHASDSSPSSEGIDSPRPAYSSRNASAYEPYSDATPSKGDANSLTPNSSASIPPRRLSDIIRSRNKTDRRCSDASHVSHACGAAYGSARSRGHRTDDDCVSSGDDSICSRITHISHACGTLTMTRGQDRDANLAQTDNTAARTGIAQYYLYAYVSFICCVVSLPGVAVYPCILVYSF